MPNDDFLRSVPLFVEFDSDELEDLRRVLHKTQFGPGDVILQTNDVVRGYFEVNRALVENPTFREAYAMCNR